VIRVFIRSIIK